MHHRERFCPKEQSTPKNTNFPHFINFLILPRLCILAAMASKSTSNSGGAPEEPVSRTDVTFLAGDDPRK